MFQSHFAVKLLLFQSFPKGRIFIFQNAKPEHFKKLHAPKTLHASSLHEVLQEVSRAGPHFHIMIYYNESSKVFDLKFWELPEIFVEMPEEKYKPIKCRNFYALLKHLSKGKYCFPSSGSL